MIQNSAQENTRSKDNFSYEGGVIAPNAPPQLRHWKVFGLNFSVNFELLNFSLLSIFQVFNIFLKTFSKIGLLTSLILCQAKGVWPVVYFHPK